MSAVFFPGQELAIESERRALLQRYEYLTKSANDIILIMDQDWKIIEAEMTGRLPPTCMNAGNCIVAMSGTCLPTPVGPISMNTMVEVEERDGLRFEALNRR